MLRQSSTAGATRPTRRPSSRDPLQAPSSAPSPSPSPARPPAWETRAPRPRPFSTRTRRSGSTSARCRTVAVRPTTFTATLSMSPPSSFSTSRITRDSFSQQRFATCTTVVFRRRAIAEPRARKLPRSRPPPPSTRSGAGTQGCGLPKFWFLAQREPPGRGTRGEGGEGSNKAQPAEIPEPEIRGARSFERAPPGGEQRRPARGRADTGALRTAAECAARGGTRFHDW